MATVVDREEVSIGALGCILSAFGVSKKPWRDWPLRLVLESCSLHSMPSAVRNIAGALLLMVEILHDSIYQNPRSSGSMVYITWCRVILLAITHPAPTRQLGFPIGLVASDELTPPLFLVHAQSSVRQWKRCFKSAHRVSEAMAGGVLYPCFLLGKRDPWGSLKAVIFAQRGPSIIYRRLLKAGTCTLVDACWLSFFRWFEAQLPGFYCMAPSITRTTLHTTINITEQGLY